MKRFYFLFFLLVLVYPQSFASDDVIKELEKKYVVSTYLEKYGFYTLEKNGQEGVANLKGKIIIPVEYSCILYQKEDEVFIVSKGSKRDPIMHDIEGGVWGLLNKAGKPLTPLKYTRLYSFAYSPGKLQIVNVGGNFDSVKKNYIVGGKYGVLNIKGEECVPCIYDWVLPIIDESLAIVNIGGKWIQEGTGRTMKGGKWGATDLKGNVVIPIEYDETFLFNSGVARSKKNGQTVLVKNPLKEGVSVQLSNRDNTPKNKVVVSRYPTPDSDVDKNIPMAKVSVDNTFAFIIANENYPDAPVPYSLNDGRMFKEYCQKALGLPEKNINMYEDATFGNIITAVEKMKLIADAYEGEASVIFYYAGHGFPDEKQSTAYLLPIDGNASDITTTGYSLAKLYKELAALKLKSAVVLLDACFSGAKREDQMLAQSRGVAIKVKNDIPEGNILVYSAAQGDETAHQLEDKHHGLFTYYLLKELQATGGDVDMGTLTEYVTKQVKRQSVVINNKKQTPTVIPSQSLINSWQTMRLR